LGTVSDFAFVPEFLTATSLLEPAEVCGTELKPFLTIFGTRMRAPLDILAVDSEGPLCVIELKDNVEDEQLDQGIRYYDWVKSNIAWLSKTFKIVEPARASLFFILRHRNNSL